MVILEIIQARHMKAQYRYYSAIFAGLIAIAVWVVLLFNYQPTFDKFAPGFIFIFLIVLTTSFGIPAAGGTVSLLPMITLAAFLVMGDVPTVSTVILSALIVQALRQNFSEQLNVQPSATRLTSLAVASANVAVQAFSVIISGFVFRALGQQTPLMQVTAENLWPLILLALTFLASNLFLAGLYVAARGRRILIAYLRSLPNLILYEALPMVFAPLVALIYTRLGWVWFIFLSIIIVIASLTIWSLSQTSRRLERRLRELASLQAVGQALSASLRLDDILQAIYTQVSRLMPVENFYVALYDPETDEVRFPLAYERDQKVQWQSRKAGKGLTEFLLSTRQPLLIKRDLEAHLSKLGIAHVGRPAKSWLGVPILAGEQQLGVIAVQSHSTPDAFDDSHREILITIAAQAGVAIQNARLYEHTDEALARRVQELNSILRTATEGLLLLNLEFGILAANRALAEFLALSQAELVEGPGDGNSLVARTGLLGLIGYSADSLAQDCQSLVEGAASDHQRVIKVLGPPERHLERTLTPVRTPQGEINGWLLVFRDLTEELELARLREDLTHMLVHDLRTPLTSLKGSLWVMRQELKQAGEHTHEMLDMSERSVDRIVGMVNSLLDIAKLETGQMPLNLELTSVALLLEDVASRLNGLASEACIRLLIDTPAGLPKVKLDPEQIRRTLTNLVDNAIKFTPDDGEVHLWARLTQDENGCNLLLGVRDTGPGIPKEAQSRLFQKFQQVHNAEARRRGTGLGLAFCKLVVEAHGGQIWVESELGQGANFVICLPLAIANQVVAQDRDHTVI